MHMHMYKVLQIWFLIHQMSKLSLCSVKKTGSINNKWPDPIGLCQYDLKWIICHRKLYLNHIYQFMFPPIKCLTSSSDLKKATKKSSPYSTLKSTSFSIIISIYRYTIKSTWFLWWNHCWNVYPLFETIYR